MSFSLFNDRERDTIVAALRLWQAWLSGQATVHDPEQAAQLSAIAQNERPAATCDLSLKQIDALVERLNKV